MVLILLAILVAALALLAAVARLAPGIAVTASRAGLCGGVVTLAAVMLATGASVNTLEFPMALPGPVMRLALDPLSASFLMVLFVVTPCASAAPLRLAAMAITLLAGNGFVLAVGLLMLGGMAALRPAAFVVVCLVVAFALADPSADFSVIRAAPPEGWRATAILLLVLAGAGVLSRLSTTLATYLVVRVLLDLCGAEQPLWWSVPLLLAGVGVAAVASFRAAVADTLHTVLSAGSLMPFGMATIGLGVAQFSRAVDLPSVESRALAGAWLALVCHMLCRTLLLLCADVVERGAGTRRLDRLGGLMPRMPVTAGCCLLGLSTIAVLPPGLGFAAFWLTFQSLLSATRAGEAGMQFLIVGVVALTATSVGLMALAAVRLAGVVFLGRPRAPRTTAAEEAARPVRLVIIGLAAVSGLLGLLPALALVPAVKWTHASASGQWLIFHISAEAPGYSPLVIVALGAMVVVAVLRVLRRPGEQAREPVWSGGFAAPPPWLPFGDPATQFGPVSFTEPLQRVLALLPSIEPIRHQLVRCRATVLRVTSALVTR